MATHPFLSPSWMAEARRIRDEIEGEAPPPAVALRANVVVTEAPFDGGEVRGFIDTADGVLLIDEGHLDDPELTIETDYDTAYALFVDQDLGAIMQAFLGGKIRLAGDATKILALPPAQDAGHLDVAAEVARRLHAVTEVPEP